MDLYRPPQSRCSKLPERSLADLFWDGLPALIAGVACLNLLVVFAQVVSESVFLSGG